MSSIPTFLFEPADPAHRNVAVASCTVCPAPAGTRCEPGCPASRGIEFVTLPQGSLDGVECVASCSNASHLDGFLPILPDGTVVSDPDEWWEATGKLVGCTGCGRVFSDAAVLDDGRHVQVLDRLPTPPTLSGVPRPVEEPDPQPRPSRTGYVLLHTTERDGEEPMAVALGLDSTDDDESARRVLAQRVASLDCGPTDVLHTLQVCERTEVGGELVDRVVDSASVRGNGQTPGDPRCRSASGFGIARSTPAAEPDVATRRRGGTERGTALLGVPELGGPAQDALERLTELAASEDRGAAGLSAALDEARLGLGGEWPIVALALGACPEHGCELQVCRDDGCPTTAELTRCARCGALAALLWSDSTLCPGCVVETCESGQGIRIGLPDVPADRVPAAVAALGRVLLLGMHSRTPEALLVHAAAQRSCPQCGATADWSRPARTNEHVLVAGVLAIDCDGAQTAALRAAALLEVIVLATPI